LGDSRIEGLPAFQRGSGRFRMKRLAKRSSGSILMANRSMDLRRPRANRTFISPSRYGFPAPVVSRVCIFHVHNVEPLCLSYRHVLFSLERIFEERKQVVEQFRLCYISALHVSVLPSCNFILRSWQWSCPVYPVTPLSPDASVNRVERYHRWSFSLAASRDPQGRCFHQEPCIASITSNQRDINDHLSVSTHLSFEAVYSGTEFRLTIVHTYFEVVFTSRQARISAIH
jgi:hypothetical protein